MDFSLLFSFVVYAAESVLSPIPEANLTKALEPKPPAVRATPQTLREIAQSAFSVTPTPAPQVLAATFEIVSPSATPTQAIKKTKKASYSIALLGDSMIDTLGPDGGGLPAKLQSTYPNTKFAVMNHGLGATNIDSGYERLTENYSYNGDIRPSLLSQKPDVIVVESFGYNPYTFSEGALETHWLKFAAIVDAIRKNLPETRIIIAATIAPNSLVFGDGAPFISFSAEGKRSKTQTIRSYIENAIKFARSQNLPLANAYTPSLGANGEGKLEYINAGDHIHYSPAGIHYMATTIAEAIVSNKLLE